MKDLLKNRKVLLVIIAGIAVLVVILIIALIPKAQNPYGFKSKYIESEKEEYKLKNYPEAKEYMLKLENCILKSGLSIINISFDNWGEVGTFLLSDSNESIKIDIDNDSEKGGKKLYEVIAWTLDDAKYNLSKNALVSFFEFSEDEAKLIDGITSENDIQTMKYNITYRDEKATITANSNGIAVEGEAGKNSSKEVTFKKLDILNHPVEDERQTNLYKVKREERKPKDENGINVDELGLSFYYPKAMKANSYNGTLYTWEFYTGNSAGLSVEGIDLTLMISGLNDTDVDTYVRTKSRPAKSTGITPFEIKEINGAKWYTCNNGKIYYYAAEFLNNVYEIEVADGKEFDGVTLNLVKEMLEKTLFFE